LIFDQSIAMRLPRTSLKLAVFAAADFEIKPLLEVLTERKIDFIACAVGVGALNAALNIREHAQRANNRDAIFVGTCGTFGSFSSPTLVQAQEVCWLPTCERVSLSYPVPGSAAPVSLANLSPWRESLPGVRVVCAPNVSLTDRLPSSYDASQCVENIELYSCAAALKHSARSLTAILCTTNAVGNDAHRQWKQNFELAASLTAKHFKEML